MGQMLENGEMAALIAACARGEHAALRVIYESEAPRLLAIALRLLKRRSLAEDAVQDAFVKIWNPASIPPRERHAVGSPPSCATAR
jgi:DNA-directed RNA polymerase specialized sigma24 family protein